MNSYRANAVVVGILFLFAITTLFIGQAFYNPLFDSLDYLEIVYQNRTTIIIGILIEFLGVLGLAFIPVLLFPVLKPHAEILARSYISIRLLEVVLLGIAQICKLMLINVSQDYLSSGGTDAAYFQDTGSLIKSALFWNDSGGIIYLLVFVTGMFMLYPALYKSRLVPRWLSIWGLVAAVGMFLAVIVATFEILPIAVALMLMMLTPLQEVTMSIWLIIKGFDPSRIISSSTVA